MIKLIFLNFDKNFFKKNNFAGLFCLEIAADDTPPCTKDSDCYDHCYPFTYAAVCKDRHCACT